MDTAEIKAKLDLIDRYHSHEISLNDLSLSLFPHSVDDLTDEQEDAFDAMVDVDLYYARMLDGDSIPTAKMLALIDTAKLELQKLLNAI